MTNIAGQCRSSGREWLTPGYIATVTWSAALVKQSQTENDLRGTISCHPHVGATLSRHKLMRNNISQPCFSVEGDLSIVMLPADAQTMIIMMVMVMVMVMMIAYTKQQWS